MQDDPLLDRDSIAQFFIDESIIQIEGREHTISCSILPTNPTKTIQRVVGLKKHLSLAALDEVKFNSSGLVQAKKILLTDGVIEIMDDCTAFICILDGNDKAEIAEWAAAQAFDYCKENSISQYTLNFDTDLVPRKKILEQYVRRLLGNTSECVGIQHLNSASDQIIQLCDLFLGLYRLSIQIEFGEKTIPRKISRSEDHGEEEWSLSDLVLLGTRGKIWGRFESRLFEVHPDEGPIYHPYHVSFGMGVRLRSPISREAHDVIRDQLATTYLGCLS